MTVDSKSIEQKVCPTCDGTGRVDRDPFRGHVYIVALVLMVGGLTWIVVDDLRHGTETIFGLTFAVLVIIGAASNIPRAWRDRHG